MTPNKDLLYGLLSAIDVFREALKEDPAAQKKCDELQEQAGTAGAQQISEGDNDK